MNEAMVNWLAISLAFGGAALTVLQAIRGWHGSGFMAYPGFYLMLVGAVLLGIMAP